MTLRRCLGMTAAALLLTVSPAVTQTAHHPEPAGFSCPGDRKVWVNTRSGVYHLAGKRYYGSTKQDEVLCEQAVRGEGDRETWDGQ